MHIKQITISNFRSFRQQPEIQPFSVATNAVVGRNGSGKSNLFDAVQFALLSPRFANLRQEERQAILHEGSGSAAVNAFVEIVFDNSDGRLAVDNSDEVVLRRTVGAKKDEFFLQRKRANKTEIQSLLEGAGFSKSNPYFIVQQGKVQDLCTMSDAERLTLLKEVAGTTVYDEKKAESLLKMEENANRIEKIDEILTSIEDRLEELQSEKDELSQYQSLDRQRRALEYTLYDKELRKARTALDGLEHERGDHGAQLGRLHSQSKSLDEAVRHLEGQVKAQHNAHHRNRLKLRDTEADSKGAVRKAVQLDLECRELTASIQAGDEQLVSNEKELEQVGAEIVAKEHELSAEVLPEFTAAQEALQKLRDEQTQARQQQDALYAKQGRGQQFQTRVERDAFLQSQLDESATELAGKEALRTQQRDRLANLRRTLAQERTEVETQTAQVQGVSQNLQQLEKRRDESHRQRLACVEARKDEWRDHEQLQEQVRESRELFHRALSEQRKTTPRATALGLESLTRLVQQEGLTSDQYMGTVLENLRLKEDRFSTAVEVAAQNALFHVIVDSDHTAARLMKRLEDDKLGRVTFLPLDQLRNEPPPSIAPGNNDVRPLLDLCVEYDAKVERAMRHVFSKKLLARTADLAMDYAKQHGVDVLTLDGDLCGRKGAMTGGYVDTNQSRIRAHVKQREAQAELRRLEREYQQKKQSAQQADQAAANVQQELSRLEAKYSELERNVTDKEVDLERLQKRADNHGKRAEEVETKELPVLDRDIAALEAERGRLQEEMGTELTETLSDADRAKLEELAQRQAELGPEIEAQSDVVNKVGVQRQKLESLLQDNLYRRRQELTQGSDDDDVTGGGSGGDGRRRRRSSVLQISSAALQAQRKEDLEEKQRQLDDAARIKEDVESKLHEARKVEQELNAELQEAKNELEQLKSKDMKNQKALEEAQEKSDRLWTKRSMCISKRETYMRKIQELGSLPPPAELEKFSGKSLQTLMTSLDDVNKKLKKYSHVNKKAYDQYVNFNEQRESLLKRKEELDQGADKVKELVDSLDLQKDEAINRTFRGVSAHFKDVFKELVPNGEGELIMRAALDGATATDDEDSGNDEDEEEDEESPSKKKKKSDPNNPDVSLYRGVGIKVRFSAVGENYLMSQLSGGQKALVAMGLIFAIQRCDPAPFYLFDELDQALDSTYRAAVANLIERQANDKDNPTQFIVSTFRPELVSVANRCYGISHQNKVSSIHPLSKRDALNFVANLMNEEEAVGEVSTVPTASMASRFTRGDSRKRKSAETAKDDGGGGDDDDDDEEADGGGANNVQQQGSPSTAASDTLVSP